MAMWRHRRSPTNVTIAHAYDDFGQYGGPFWTLETHLPGRFPWPTNLDAHLDYIYLMTKSGNKFAAPMINRILKNMPSSYDEYFRNNGILPPELRNGISSEFAARYYSKWEHLFNEIYNANYSPLNVADYTEQRTRNASINNTKNLSDTLTRPTKTIAKNSTRTPNLTEQRTPNLTEQRTPNLTDTTVAASQSSDSGIDSQTTTFGKVVTEGGNMTRTLGHNEFGFNTSAEGGVPISVDTESVTPRQTTTDSGTEGVSGTNSNTSNSRDNSTLTRTGSESTTRTGTETITNTGTEGISEQETETYNANEVKTTAGTDNDVINEGIRISRSGSMFRPPAELLSLDRDLWLWDFFEIVFDDVDSILTLNIYSDSPVEHFYWGQEIN